MTISHWVRPQILAMTGYVPGEQPALPQAFVKLNTNENPFGPPPEVLDAIRCAVDSSLRLYPEPSSRPVRVAAARAYGLSPDQIVVGNGSDDLLTMIFRTFVEPGEIVAAPEPTYTLYSELVEIQGGIWRAAAWQEDGSIPLEELCALRAKVTLITRPNAPTGLAAPLTEVATLCRRLADTGIVVLDEAYADFADDQGLPLLPDHPNLVIIRSFSKSLSLAGMRLGLGFMSVELARELHKVRDSYNVDRIAQEAAVAALSHLSAYLPALEAIKSERQRLRLALEQRGFHVPPSQANFLLARVPAGRRSGKAWNDDLKHVGILVRYFGADPRLTDKLRITIGTSEQNDRLLDALDGLLTSN